MQTNRQRSSEKLMPSLSFPPTTLTSRARFPCGECGRMTCKPRGEGVETHVANRTREGRKNGIDLRSLSGLEINLGSRASNRVWIMRGCSAWTGPRPALTAARRRKAAVCPLCSHSCAAAAISANDATKQTTPQAGGMALWWPSALGCIRPSRTEASSRSIDAQCRV